MGRKPLPKAKVRSVYVILRVTPEERKRLLAAAKAAGKTWPAWHRERLGL